jgi:hypothetical protein
MNRPTRATIDDDGDQAQLPILSARYDTFNGFIEPSPRGEPVFRLRFGDATPAAEFDADVVSRPARLSGDPNRGVIEVRKPAEPGLRQDVCVDRCDYARLV